MMYHVKLPKSGHEEKGTICLYSNVIPTGEEDTTKPNKVTITSSKKEKKKRKRNTNKRKQQSFMPAPDVSLLLAGCRSRIPTPFPRVGI